jgi:molybdopterin-guanine dinucleotide biosynthesis protein A
MIERGKIAGLVLAGGQSRRFGGQKALAMLGGETLVARMARMLGQDCGSIAISGSEALFGPAWPALPDPPGAPSGPLAGVLAGLRWASSLGAEWLVTAPCDTPLLPDDFTRQLIAGAQQAKAGMAVFASADGLHPLTAAWRTSLLPALEQALQARHPPAHELAEQLAAARVLVAPEHLINVNTPEDLERAGQILASRY